VGTGKGGLEVIPWEACFAKRADMMREKRRGSRKRGEEKGMEIFSGRVPAPIIRRLKGSGRSREKREIGRVFNSVVQKEENVPQKGKVERKITSRAGPSMERGQ